MWLTNKKNKKKVSSNIRRKLKFFLVQISDCETAVIGGFRGTNDSSSISIYNWHRDEWKEGPRLRKYYIYFLFIYVIVYPSSPLWE